MNSFFPDLIGYKMLWIGVGDNRYRGESLSMHEIVIFYAKLQITDKCIIYVVTRKESYMQENEKFLSSLRQW